MNRAERRRSKREESSKVKLSKWASGLDYDKKKLIHDVINESICDEIEVCFKAWEVGLRVELNEIFGSIHYCEEIIDKIIDSVREEARVIGNYKGKGKEYVMKIRQDASKIIEMYESLKAGGMKDKKIYDEIWSKFANYSKTAVKNIILEYLRDKKERACISTTCSFMKEGQCTNEVVLSGKGTCQKLNSVVSEVKTSKMTKKDMLFRFFERNVDMEKLAMLDKAAKEFNMNKHLVSDYFYRYNKERGIVMNDKKAKEIEERIDVIEDEVNKNVPEIKETSKYKVLNEVIKRDIQGEFGVYKIDNKVMEFNGEAYSSKEEIEASAADNIAEINKRIKELNDAIERVNKNKEEAIEIMSMFM